MVETIVRTTSEASQRELITNIVPLLKKINMFEELRDEELLKVASVAKEKHYDPDDVIFLEGDPGDALYVIRSGRVRITKTTQDGKEQTLDILEAGDVFGEMSILDEQPRSASARAASSLNMVVISKQDFLNLLDSHPHIALEIVRFITGRLRQANQEFRELRDITIRIEGMLNIISKIAKQSKLLAINASIEAARAGELGRGFNVVAVEIGKLSERSADATAKIAELTNAIKEKAIKK
ncbi:MAG: cyclic nucleotide-binding domain-containing protein [bacterium]